VVAVPRLAERRCEATRLPLKKHSTVVAVTRNSTGAIETDVK
jgi:hypothetical protein